MKLEGIHHITCITGDAPRNVDFYARLMGLRLVKKSVNQDDPTVYHLFFGDEEGAPGNDITFFEYPGARPGRAGAGMINRIVWRVDSDESVGYWQRGGGGGGRGGGGGGAGPNDPQRRPPGSAPPRGGGPKKKFFLRAAFPTSR